MKKVIDFRFSRRLFAVVVSMLGGRLFFFASRARTSDSRYMSTRASRRWSVWPSWVRDDPLVAANTFRLMRASAAVESDPNWLRCKAVVRMCRASIELGTGAMLPVARDSAIRPVSF